MRNAHVVASMALVLVACSSEVETIDDIGGKGDDAVETDATPGGAAVDARAVAPDAAPDAPPGSMPSIASVTVEESPGSTQVPQGRSFTLVVTGAQLDAVRHAVFDGLATFPSQRSATELRFHLHVSRGHAFGPIDLVLRTETASFTRAGAVTVTPIVVAIEGDDGNIGTHDAPKRTIDAGLREAGSGATVVVRPGRYGAGEPQQISLYSGVTLVGAGPDKTIVETQLIPYAGATLRGIRVPCTFDASIPGQGGVTYIVDVELAGCSTGILLRHGAYLQDVRITGSSTGIDIQASAYESYTLNRVTISSPDTGLRIAGPAFARLDGVTVDAGEVGIELVHGAQASVRSTHVTAVAPRGRGLAVVVASAGRILDFGTSSEPGNNVLTGGMWSIEDVRPPRAAADGPIVTVSSSQIGDVLIPPGILTGLASVGYVRIDGANNRIQIF